MGPASLAPLFCILMHKAYIWLLICLLGLAACAEDKSEPESSPTSEPPPPTRQFLEIASPWSVSVYPNPIDGQRWLVAISHAEGHLTLWEIDQKRNTRILARAEVGFHPDGVRWLSPVNDHSRTLAVTVEGKSVVQLWRYDSSLEQLNRLVEIPVTDPPQTVAVADLDCDGRTDLVLGPYDGKRLTLLWNDGNHQFSPQFLNSDQTPVYPALSDWNGDGRTDIVWSDWYAGTVRWAKNHGERQLEIIALDDLDGEQRPRQVIPADVDGDGADDLVIGLEVGEAALILYGDGQGGIARKEQVPAPGMGYVTAAVRGSGNEVELALAEIDAVVFARRAENGGWRLRRIRARNGVPQDLHYTDLDGDGHEDLVFANSAGREVEILFGPDYWEQAEKVSPE
ncbi:MAG: VCBS repeat-containing protein [Candidatus Competibacterales bacterium]|nr:VCBS repeat-containing protein [Candidatus Competibacterales bacterium]